MKRIGITNTVIALVIFFVFFISWKVVNLYIFPVKKVVRTAEFNKDSLMLEVTDSTSFKMDDLTSPGVIWSEQYVEANGSRYLSFLNIVAKNIYFYNLNDQRLSSVLTLDSLGLSSDETIQGFCLLPGNNILIYNYAKSRWTFINKSKGKIAQGDLDSNSFSMVSPFVTTAAPILYDSSQAEVYFIGTSTSFGDYERDKQRNALIRLNIKTGEFTYDVSYPEIFWGRNWGGFSGFERPAYTLNTSAGILAVNFMTDNDLTLYNTKSHKVNKVTAGSKFFTGLKSLDFHPTLNDFYPNKVLQHYLDNFAYLAISYDKFRNVYYRMTEFPTDSSKMSNSNTFHKKNSILILDGLFNVVGETLLPQGKYAVESFFVSEDGLHLRRNDIHNDEYLIYDCLKLQPNRQTNVISTVVATR